MVKLEEDELVERLKDKCLSCGEIPCIDFMVESEKDVGGEINLL